MSIEIALERFQAQPKWEIPVKARLGSKFFSHRDPQSRLRYAPSGHSKALNQRRKSDFGTVFVLPRPMVGKTKPHGPRDVCLPSVQVHIAAGQVEASDGFHYSWP